MTGFFGSIEDMSVENENFRKVVFTSKHLQLVVMSLKPEEEIGNEKHDDVDQFFRIEEGHARFVLSNGDEEYSLNSGGAAVVPAGTWHNVINSSKTQDLKLYTVYTPPQHPDGTVHKTKEEAEAAEKAEHK
jgi:mannose-6-phosphate isomerase-like protein (cupin superfamily)